MPPRSKKSPAMKSKSRKRKAKEMEELPDIPSHSFLSDQAHSMSLNHNLSTSFDPGETSTPDLPKCLRSRTLSSPSSSSNDHIASNDDIAKVTPSNDNIAKVTSTNNHMAKAGQSERDQYCWLCHSKGYNTECATCCRVFHNACLKKSSYKFDNLNKCKECQADSVDGTELSMFFTTENLKKLLNTLTTRVFRNKWEKHHTFFSWPVKLRENSKLVKIIDCAILLDIINHSPYTKTAEFYSDVKFIHHNAAIVYGIDSDEAKSALLLEKDFRREILDLEACPECYRNIYCSEDESVINPFLRLCNPPHDIVWAQLKGYPYWPAKCLKVIKGVAHVKFFGKHEHSDISVKKCYMISMNHPKIKSLDLSKEHSGKKSRVYDSAKSELFCYVRQYEIVHNEFHYSKIKTPYQPKEAKSLKDKSSKVNEQSSEEESHSSSKTSHVLNTLFTPEGDKIRNEGSVPNIPTIENTTTFNAYEGDSQREESINDIIDSNGPFPESCENDIEPIPDSSMEATSVTNDEKPSNFHIPIPEDIQRITKNDHFSIVDPVMEETVQNEIQCSVGMNNVSMVCEIIQEESESIDAESPRILHASQVLNENDHEEAIIDAVPIELSDRPAVCVIDRPADRVIDRPADRVIDQQERRTAPSMDWVENNDLVQVFTQRSQQFNNAIHSRRTFMGAYCGHAWIGENMCPYTPERRENIIRKILKFWEELQKVEDDKRRQKDLQYINSGLLLEYAEQRKNLENLKKRHKESINNARLITLGIKRTVVAKCTAEFNAKFADLQRERVTLKKQLLQATTQRDNIRQEVEQIKSKKDTVKVTTDAEEMMTDPAPLHPSDQLSTSQDLGISHSCPLPKKGKH
ncbi:protein kinase C-binding protein 1 [Caerostris darwini]|uniref:Protein kinase C-binding protein 1 n=1 Tax=Caerostris darwini TaxID=1538125 RepID=A0AAV4WFP4_9ARAC|nr:protein kinase C-binding protein 1 [Caerostris darwini]